MKVLLGSAQPFLPQVAGGAQTSTHEIALELKDRGHDVAVIAGLTGDGWLGFRGRVLLKILRRHSATDHCLSYPAFRGWSAAAAIPEVVKNFKPDVAVISTAKGVPLGQALQRIGVPVVMYLRDVEFEELEGALADLPGALYLANSQFTADAYHDRYGVTSTVIPPLFQESLYRTTTSRRYVTLVNPHRKKGVELALDIAAACPDIAFCFVSGWKLSDADDAWLKVRLAATPNIILKPRTSNMRTIYAETKILLAPSQWEEAWGRVVSEAHYSGIPTIATRIGGLPQSVGSGGILIEKGAPVSAWVKAVRSLWDDKVSYDAISQAALDYAARSELCRADQFTKFLKVLNAAASQHIC